MVGHGRRWTWWRTVATVLLVVAVGATATVWDAHRPEVRRPLAETTVRPDRGTELVAGGVTVRVPAGAVDRPTRLTIDAPVEIVPPEGARSGPGYRISLAGAVPHEPLTVALPLPPEADLDTAVWIGHLRFDGWRAEPAMVDPVARTVTARVDDLSLFAVQWLDLGWFRDRLAGMVGSALQGIANVVLYGSPTGPDRLLCPGVEEAARRGVTVEVGGDRVPACVGITGEWARVQLVNTHPYPVLLRFPPGVALRGRGGDHADVAGVVESLFAELPSAGPGGATVLRPGESADLVVDPATRGTVLHLEPSPVALHGVILESAVDMLATVVAGMARLDLVTLPPGVPADPGALADLWDVSRCAPVLAEAAGRADPLPSLARDAVELTGCLAELADRTVGGATAVVGDAVGVAASLVAPPVQQLAGSLVGLSDAGRGARTALTVRLAPDRGDAAPSVVRSDSQVMLLLVDTSGSMAEDDGAGTVKIEGARAAIREALSAAPPGALFGLRSYPDTGSTCGPGQVRYSFVAPDDPGLLAAVNTLTTGGQTPTGPALRAAADMLLELELHQPATIVLVSDGLSNCGPDPCAVAQEIAAQGLAVIYTVGFQLDAEGLAELRCISEATGGETFDAGDSEALAETIAEAAAPALTLDVTVSPDEPVPPAGLVSVEATVANPTAHQVRDVRLHLFFPLAGVDGTAPVVVGPLRSLGNLDPGTSQVVRWQFRAPATTGVDLYHDVVVTASAANAATVQLATAVRYARTWSRELAGPLLRDATRVVIMGDSFSSGEGAGDYHPETNRRRLVGGGTNMCHRSDRTYAVGLDWPEPPVILACSGSVTDQVLGRVPTYDEPSQIERLAALDPPPDMVLLTIGGNDIGFGDIVADCLLHDSCHRREVSPNPELDPDCHLRYIEAYHERLQYPLQLPGCPSFSVPYSTIVFARIEGARDKLRETYRAIDAVVNSRAAIKARGGRPAHIVVLAYPLVLPRLPYGADSCLLGMDHAEARFGAEVTDRLNAVVARTVAELRVEGRPVYFASDVAEALLPNHTLCDREPHVNPIEPGRLLTFGFGQSFQEQVHPTAEGYADMTAALLRWSLRPEAEPVSPVLPVPTQGPAPARLVGEPVRLGSSPENTAGSFPADTAVRVEASGFAPGTTVYVSLHSTPRGLANVWVESDGSVSTVVYLPADLAPGPHVLTASGIGPDGRPVERYAVLDVRRPDRPWRTALWGLAAALLVAAGVVVPQPTRPHTG